MKKILLGFLILSSLVLVTGCKESLQVGSEKIAEKSQADKPNWLNKAPDNDADNLYFVGQTESGSIDGVRDAYQLAISKVSSTIGVYASSAYEVVDKAFGNEVGKKMRDEFIQNLTKQNIIRGVKEKQNYWEKMEVSQDKGVRYYYRVYSLAFLPKKSFEQSVNEVLTGQINGAKDALNTKLQESLELTRTKLLNEINK